MVFPSIPHRVLCNFWQCFLIEIFGFRSTILIRFLQDTLLTKGFFGVLGFHRWSPIFPPPPAHQRVAYTRQRVLHSRRRVANTSVPSAFQRLGHRWFRVKLVFPDDERPPLGSAWISRAVKEDSHSSINRTSAAYFTVCAVFLLYFWVVLLYSSPTVYPYS
jgi:hypothetical protein